LRSFEMRFGPPFMARKWREEGMGGMENREHAKLIAEVAKNLGEDCTGINVFGQDHLGICFTKPYVNYY